MKRLAKIVATLGPSTKDESVLRQLIEAGVDVARLNFSHGEQSEHAEHITLIRRLSKELGKPITILQDLQGPKIRVGKLLGGPVPLKTGETVCLDSNPMDNKTKVQSPEQPLTVPVDFPELPQCLLPGNPILLDDGRLELRTINVMGDLIEAEVIQGGTLSSHKGINLPGSKIVVPGFTQKDRRDLKFGIEKGVDAVAVSFVRTANDIEVVRNAIQEFAPKKPSIPIIAKLERPEALKNLESILEISNGVMVARGDLGVEMSPALVPIAQKNIIEAANRTGKFVITATQMLESMINDPRPTRAEASDVANAVFDGTDAVMLSGETAVGKYPVETVIMMDQIVRQAEENYDRWGKCPTPPINPTEDDAISMTRAAKELAHDRDVAAITVFTQTGRTALLMSKMRPLVPILAFTPEVATYQTMGLYWGVFPYLIPFVGTMEAMIKVVEETIMASTDIKPGEQIILISGFPLGEMRLPNFALLHTIG